MAQAQSIVNALKRCLKSRGMTYRDLAAKLGISEVSVKRMFSGKKLSLDRLEEICRALDMSFYDLAKMSTERTDNESEQLTLTQEEALAKNDRLFCFFYLLMSGKSSANIVKNYQFSPAEATRHLIRLDELGLIELQIGNRVKPRVSINYHWIKGGPLERRYAGEIKKEFLQVPFTNPNERLRLLGGYLSERSMQALKKRMDRIIIDFREMSEADCALQKETKASQPSHPIWFMVACRPWVFSPVSRLRR